MARIDTDDLLKTAKRFAESEKKQEAQEKTGLDGIWLEAEMLNKRRDYLNAMGTPFLESMVGKSDMFPIRYFEIGQIAARSVGRIHVVLDDGRSEGYGTGFLVAPGILLTNHHVLRTHAWASAATLTLDAEDNVDGLPRAPRIFQLDPDRLYVSDEELDFCFVAVRPHAVDGTPLDRYGYFRLFPATGKIMREEYATIIQHPGGRQKHVAARNNRIRVYVYDDPNDPAPATDNNFIYYSTDTLRGSSGAPVLSDQWFVFALHRRGVPKIAKRNGKTVIMRLNGKPAADDDPEEVVAFETNEGVRISRIVARLKAIAAADTKDSAAANLAHSRVIDAAGTPEDGPLSTPVSRAAALQAAGRSEAGVTGPVLEIQRRKTASFPDDLGYDENFLEGFSLPLPVPSPTLRAAMAPRKDKPNEVLLPFRHFTTAMHARRRLPVFAAINISAEGKPSGGMGKRPAWSYDPRISDEHQPDDTIFSQMVQRGHLAAREYVYWGEDDDVIGQADVHSFTLTNVCPQIARFNGHQEWYEIERQVAKAAKAEKLSIVEFVGPFFGPKDPDYDTLRGAKSSANFDTNIKLPLRFWKIVVWVEDGELKHKALILDQSEELNAAGPLEFDLATPDGVKETTVAYISQRTGLTFPAELSAVA